MSKYLTSRPTEPTAPAITEFHSFTSSRSLTRPDLQPDPKADERLRLREDVMPYKHSVNVDDIDRQRRAPGRYPARCLGFVAALKQRNGILALSCTNLIEFCNVTDDQQARQAEELLEASLPHVFFVEMDPFLVQKREDDLVRGGLPTPPHEDRELLTTLVRLKPQSVLISSDRTDALEACLSSVVELGTLVHTDTPNCAWNSAA